MLHSVNTYSKSFTNNFDMKSIQAGDTLLNDSSSKSYFAIVTLAIVSISVSPIKGERPEILLMSKSQDANKHVFKRWFGPFRWQWLVVMNGCRFKSLGCKVNRETIIIKSKKKHKQGCCCLVMELFPFRFRMFSSCCCCCCKYIIMLL